MFSIALISPLGPHSGSGAVPWTPATPPHSPPLRDRPGDALFCMFRRPPGSTNAKQRTACKGRQCEPSLSETAHVSLGCCSALLLLSLLLVWRFRPSVFPFQPLFCRRAPRSRSKKNNLSQGQEEEEEEEEEEEGEGEGEEEEEDGEGEGDGVEEREAG